MLKIGEFTEEDVLILARKAYRQAYERSFKVVFGSDVTSTDDPTMQEPELKVMRKGFARVLSAEEILAALDESG